MSRGRNGHYYNKNKYSRVQQTMAPSKPGPEASTASAAASSSTSTNRHENSNPLLDQALRKHLESLQPEDRAAFEHCTAEEVIAAAERLSSAHAAQSRTRRYLARFVDIVGPLESYFDLVGNAAGSLPVGTQLGGIVWGALRFVIKVWLARYFPAHPPPLALCIPRCSPRPCDLMIGDHWAIRLL